MKHITAKFLALVAVACLPLPISGATFSVTPNTISNSYPGVITLQVGGLNAGEAVVVEQLSDFDGDGTPEEHDFTLASFPLVDGQVTAVGGVTNLHVPGDLSGVSGSITAELHMPVMGFQRRAVGKHVFRLSSPTSRFPAVLAPFTVTNTPYGAEVSGKIKSAGTNVPFALVVLFKASGDEVEPVLAGASDATGNYRLSAPPDEYAVAAFKSNYVADFSSPAMVALMPGGNVSTDVTVLPGSRVISGRVADSVESARGIGGTLMVAESENGQVAVGFTDGNGNYSVGVTPGLWQIGPDESDLNCLGYAGIEEWPGADCTTGNATVPIAVPKGTALIYGVVRTDTGTPLPGLSMWGGNWPNGNSVNPRTDQNGRYFSSVPAGTWQIGLSSEGNASLAGYAFTRQAQDLSLAAGGTVLWNFAAKAAPYTISGYLRTTTLAAVPGVKIWGACTSGGLDYVSEGMTDDSGFFTMPVFSGQWSIDGVCDGDDGLRVRGFACMSGTVVTVANGPATANLTATLCGGLQITTSSLPNGRPGEPYSTTLQAESCGGPLYWSLANGSGALPQGLNLTSNGQISGTPIQAGQFSFTVRVDDDSGTATKSLTLTIENPPPLTILSGNPANATNGVPYMVTLQGNGGKPPYTWSLVPGSGPLPGGLVLSTSGDISGTPNQTGEFYFRVRLTDAMQASVEQLLRLMVQEVVVPLDITTTSLPAGTVGMPYSVTLGASGGKTPYYWHMALGSAALPPGLTLVESTGQITGTPSASGTFQFIVHIQDSATFTGMDEQTLSLTIQPASGASLGGASIGGDGRFQFRIDGAQGTTYTIETSSDLKTWTTLRSTNAPSSSFIFVADPPSGAQGYFRVRTGQ